MSKPTNRPKRVPLSAQRQNLLKSEPRKGFVQRWVNTEDGRVESFKLAGWTPADGSADNNHRRAQDGSNVGSIAEKVVNRDPNAAYKTAVLMEIPEELYREDQLAKYKKIDDAEKAFDPAKQSQDGADYGEMKLSKK